MNWIFVGVGGFLGSVARYGVSTIFQRLAGITAFPYGTLAVNVLGCAAIGFLSQVAETRGILREEVWALMVVGFLGGFTTFSTFGNETYNLFRGQQAVVGLLNLGIQIGLGLAAVGLGRMLANWIWPA